MTFHASPTRRRLLQAALAAGAAPAFIRHACAAVDVPRFGLGLASGCPRPNGMVLWTKLTGPELPSQVPVGWEVAEDEQFRRVVARGSELAVAEDAHSVHAEARGLQSDRWHWYRFQALGQQSVVGRTRTAPARDARVAQLRFAIASCQRYDHGEFAAWRDMAAQELDVVMFLGDYIYESATTAANKGRPRVHTGGVARTLDEYRQRYAQYKSDASLQALHLRAPWIFTWDDHEVSNDWAGNVSEDLDPHFEIRRAAAAKAYWEHMPSPKNRRPDAYSLLMHERYDWGSLARIITTDDRQFRDAEVCPKPGKGGSNTVAVDACPAMLDPNRTLLGRDQERWLAAQWDAERPWNLLAQQTLMARQNWEPDPALPHKHWTDGWDGYPAARARLLRDLAAARVPNAVVLGGDVHANYVTDLKADFDRPDSATLATEFCGTSITSEGLRQQRIDDALPRNPHIHYARSDERGYMLFELQPGQLQARLRTVADIWKADSAVGTAAQFVVEAGRPGAQKA